MTNEAMTDTKTTIQVLEEFANKYAKRADFVGLGEHAMADMFRAFARDVRIDLLPAILAQQAATPAPAPHAGIRAFEERLNALRDQDVSQAFHEIVAAAKLIATEVAAQQPAKSAVPAGEREADARIHAVADGLFAHQRIGDKVPSMDRDDFREIIGAAIAGWSVQQVQADAGEREALQHVVDCWEAAEVEGLQQALSDARAYSQNTTAGRLADFLNRRISHGIERARAILRATNDTGASNGN